MGLNSNGAVKGVLGGAFDFIGRTAKSLSVVNEGALSSYTGKISSSATGTTFAIASGVAKVKFQSMEVTAVTEFAVITFGTSSSNAITNAAISGGIGLQGALLYSGDSTLGVAPSEIDLKVPDNATHCCITNGVSAQVQVVMVNQVA